MNHKQDYNDFMNSNMQATPIKSKAVLLESIKKDLNHYHWHALGKITLIHLLVGFLTLLLCPQFGVGPFAAQFGLDDFFMRFGHTTCTILCGFLFMGTSVISLMLVLKPGEFLYLRTHQIPLFSALASASLLVLGFLSHWFDTQSVSVATGLIWLVAAIAGAMIICALTTRNQKDSVFNN